MSLSYVVYNPEKIAGEWKCFAKEALFEIDESREALTSCNVEQRPGIASTELSLRRTLHHF